MKLTGIFLSTVVALSVNGTLFAQDWKSGVEWLEPPVVTPGAANSDAPSDAIILFDGTTLADWENGEKWLVEDGVAIPQQDNIYSKRGFGDIQFHIEWSAPTEIRGNSQGRGNSGIFFMNQYEVQVLDSYQNPTYFDGQSGGIYKQTPPMVNAMRRPGEWNTYDIFFTAPRFKVNGDVETPAFVTVMHNGVLVVNHFELLGPTEFTKAPHYRPHAEREPIRLQFHNDPVRFRNIWVRDLHPPVGVRTSAGFHLTHEPPKPKKDEPAAAEEPAGASDEEDVKPAAPATDESGDNEPDTSDEATDTEDATEPAPAPSEPAVAADTTT